MRRRRPEVGSGAIAVQESTALVALAIDWNATVVSIEASIVVVTPSEVAKAVASLRVPLLRTIK
jgi:hypothetical protein